jgi:hypothetical protein
MNLTTGVPKDADVDEKTPGRIVEPSDGEWLARDGVWRSFATDPPAFPGEVVATRGAEDDAGEEQGEDRAEEGVVAGVDAWERFALEGDRIRAEEPEVGANASGEDRDPAGVDEETLERWRVWVEEADG